MPKFSSGLFWSLLSASCFALQLPLIKLANKNGLDPNLIISSRAIILAIALGIYFKIKSKPIFVQAPYFKWLIIFASTSALVSITYLSSIKFLPIAIATLTFYTYPLWILFIDPLISKYKANKWSFALFGIIFLGLFLAVGGSNTSFSIIGITLALTASLGAASQFMIAPHFNAHVSALHKMFWIHSIIIIPTAIVAAFTVEQLPTLETLTNAAIPAILAIIIYFSALSFQFIAFKNTKPSLMSLIFCIEPIISITLAKFLLNEDLLPLQYLGGSIVIAGILASVWLETLRQKQA